MLLLLLACTPVTSETDTEPVLAPVSVDPMIATGGPGFSVGSSTPAATVPFGMVKIGPDTTTDNGWLSAYHCSGYYYDDNRIAGFSHMHMHGTGVPGYGQVLTMPLLGFDADKQTPEGYRGSFSHDQEASGPGWYEVTMDDGIRVELTATRHAALHRYSFPDGEKRAILFDLSVALDGTPMGGEVTVDPAAGTVSGFAWVAGPFVGIGFPTYFYAVVDGGIGSFGSWADGPSVDGQTHAVGIATGAWVEPKEQRVTMRVGISRTSVEAARANLEAEAKESSWETVKAEAEAAWQEDFSRIQIYGATDDQRKIFWTAVYHALQMPNEQGDADGSYVGFDNQLHPSGGFVYSSDMSLWDTYRTAHSFYDLLYPEKARDFAASLLAMAQQGGAFPRWPVANGEGGSMLGSPADIVLSETAIKGIDGWDQDAAWPLLRDQAMGKRPYPYNGRPDPKMIAHYGYYPNDLVGDSVAWTQEVAWADAALSHFARFRGENEDAAFFYHRSLSYRNLYDPAVGFFHGRLTDGSFDPVFDEISWLHDYTEGNAWQYLWLAPHDPNGLATLLGGEEKAKERLEFFFQGLVNEGILAFPQTYYWHGNEPDLHAALLFTLWGDPDRTTYWLRWIQENLYGTGPDGLAGNDDGGTLSAWYIFTATGLYPIAGSDLYIAVVPLFPKTTMELPDGTFTIRREGEGDHLVRVTLDGQLVPDLLIHHSQLHGGGELVFQVE